MADGDLITGDYQFEVRTTLFGAGTSFGWREPGALLSHDIKDSDVDVVHGPGRWSGAGWSAGDTKSLSLVVTGTSGSNLQSSLATLRTAWVPAASDVPLVFQFPGLGKRRIYGRPGALRVNQDHRFPNAAQVLAQFEVTDPYTYPNAESSQAFAASATHSIANAGNVASVRWTATFAATSSGAKLLHVPSGLFLDFDGVSISGTSYVADGRNRTVLQSTTNKYGDLTAISEFFALDPGSQNLTYTTDSGSGGCTFAWRSAYA